MIDPTNLSYDERGLVAVVVQDVTSGAVLMLAWADREALDKTIETGKAHFWSRSRQQLWMKGETSGNTLEVVSMTADCDRDAVLVRARPAGPTCHRGTRSCFEPNPARLEMGWLEEVVESRRGSDPESSYSARLLAAGVERVAQKVGEEGVETALAAVVEDGRIEDEAADLLYHLVVLLVARGVPVDEVARVLAARHAAGTAGGEEKGDA